MRPRPTAFSVLLQQVAQGQTFMVLSYGRPVATLAPAGAVRGGNGDSRHALLVRLATQTASGEPRSWRREMHYD